MSLGALEDAQERKRVLLGHARMALEAGSVLPALRWYGDALQRARTDPSRGALLGDLADVLGEIPMALSERERSEALQIVGEYPGGNGIWAERTIVAEWLARAPSLDETPEIGRANILFIAEVSPSVSIGAMQPMRVEIDTSGAINVLAQCQADEEFRGAYDAGCGAAKHWLCARDALGGLAASRELNELACTATFANIRGRLEGRSVGLGSAAAAVSAALRLPIPPEIAWTGRIEANGTVSRVDGIARKVEAAAGRGASVVYIPAVVEVPRVSGMEVRCVKTLDAALQSLYSPDELKEGLARFRDRLLSVRVGSGRPKAYHPVWETDLRRVLVSWVGNRDPWPSAGNRPFSLGTPKPGDDDMCGAIMTLAERLRPAEVHLLYTVVPEDDNDLTLMADATQLELEHEVPGVKIFTHPLEEVLDPTDLDQLYHGAEVSVADVLASRGREGETLVCVNGSSGTPQMTLAMLLLVERYNQAACMMQIRAPRYIKSGVPRIRQYALPLVQPRASRVASAANLE